MGLDMYAYSMSEDAVIDDFSYDRDYATTEIRYWRKHNALHNWMEKLFRSKGGTNTFNCIPLRLSKEDMELLILDIKTSKVTPVTGFFFGSQDYYDDDAKSNDIRFAHQVMAEIDDGKAVYYDSWW
jgi:hypothetical protein